MAVPISVDHKLSTPSERQRVSQIVDLPATATRIPGGLAVSRALGDHFLKGEATGLTGEPFVCAPMVVDEKDTYVVLASDGLWDIIDGQTCCDVLAAQPPTMDCTMRAQALLKMALDDRSCNDNVTVMVARLN